MCDSITAIGAVFTPLSWAKWVVAKFDLVKHWQNGAIICDPTAGEGAFAIALIESAIQDGIDFSDRDLSRIVLIERDSRYCKKFLLNFHKICDRQFPVENLITTDVILDPPQIAADYLVGNPPWANFNDLPPVYKEALKPFYLSAGLISNQQKLLLGGSRIDIAALVIITSLKNLLKAGGEAFFFIPLSLFKGEQAHEGFRHYMIGQTPFQVKAIWEFNESKIFDNVSTSYGFAHFQKGNPQIFPISYYTEQSGGWMENQALPLKNLSGSLMIINSQLDDLEPDLLMTITVTQNQKPRQGVNTCGANGVFIFDHYPDFLPSEFIYPLATKEVFQTSVESPQKFILLPYHQESAQPLTELELRSYPNIWDYLNSSKEILSNRKGMMLGAWIKRGFWWALLGVGKYNFSPYKVIWEAYGKSLFRPIILTDYENKQWQANQAMQAFIPCTGSFDAARIARELGSGIIEKYLTSLGVGGSCNWAQPGRIKQFLEFVS